MEETLMWILFIILACFTGSTLLSLLRVLWEAE